MKKQLLWVGCLSGFGLLCLFSFRVFQSSMSSNVVERWLSNPHSDMTDLRSKYQVLMMGLEPVSEIEESAIVVLWDPTLGKVVGDGEKVGKANLKSLDFRSDLARRYGVDPMSVVLMKQIDIEGASMLPRSFTGRVWLLESPRGDLAELAMGRNSILATFSKGKLISIERGHISW